MNGYTEKKKAFLERAQSGQKQKDQKKAAFLQRAQLGANNEFSVMKNAEKFTPSERPFSPVAAYTPVTRPLSHEEESAVRKAAAKVPLTPEPVMSGLEKIDRAYAAKHPEIKLPYKKDDSADPAFGYKQVKEQIEKIGVPSQMSDEQLERVLTKIIDTDYVTPAQEKIAGIRRTNESDFNTLTSELESAKEKQEEVDRNEAYLKELYDKRATDKYKRMTDEELDAEIEAVGNPNPLKDIFSSSGDLFVTDVKSTAPKAEKYQREVIDVYESLPEDVRDRIADVSQYYDVHSKQALISGKGETSISSHREHQKQVAVSFANVKNELYSLGYNDGDIHDILSYARYLSNAESAKKLSEDLKKATTGELIAANLESIPANLTSGVGQADITLQTWRNRYTKNYRPVDYYTPATERGRYAREVRGETSERLLENGHPVWNFVYSTGMSMADSAVAMAMTGKLAPILLSGSAGLNAIYDAKERGASDREAVNFGIMSAISEALFEKISVDSLFKAKDIKGLKSFTVNMLKQMFTEGTEEVNTSVFNSIADAIIMGDKSEMNTNITKYMTEGGYSREEAEKLAWRDYINSLGIDFLGGMLSGGVFGAVDSKIKQSEYESRYITRNMTEEERAAVKQAYKDYHDGLLSEEGKKIFEAAYEAAGDPMLATEEALGKYEADKIKRISELLIEAGESKKSARRKAALISLAFDGQALNKGEAQSIAQSKAALDVFNRMIGTNISYTNLSETSNAIHNATVKNSDIIENRRKQSGAESSKMRTLLGKTAEDENGNLVGEVSEGLKSYYLYQVPEMFLGEYLKFYDAGQAGMSLEKAESLFKSSRMPAYMKQAAYRAGVADANAKKNATAHKTTANPKAKFIDNEFSVNISVDVKNRLEAVAHALGRNVRFGSLYGKGAEYDRNTGDIVVNVNSKNPVQDLLLHEATHDFAVQDPEGFKKYQSYVIKTKLKNGTLNAEIEEIEKKYEKQGKRISRADLLEEIAANHTREMQSDIGLFEKFCADTPNIAQRFLNAIKRFIAKIKRAFGKANSASELERAAELWEASLNRIRRNVDKQRSSAEKQSAREEKKAAKEEKKAAKEDNTVIDARINKNDDLDIGETDTEVDALGIYDGEYEGDDVSYDEDPAEDYSDGEDAGDGPYFIEDVIEDEDGNIHENVVVIDTDIFRNTKPRDFGKVLRKYVYKTLAGKPFLAKDNYGNDVTIEFARINERVRKDGASRAHRAIDEVARKNDRNSQYAVAQADELIYVSKESGGNSEHKHQWLDENGWKFRTAKMQLPSGEIYEVTLNIGRARDGRNILYDINKIKNIGRATLPESGNKSGSGSHTNSDVGKSIPQNEPVVNSKDKMSFIEDVEGDEGYVTSAELEENAKKHINARSSNEITDMGIRKMARETKIPEADLQNLRRIYRKCRHDKADSEEFNRLIFIARGLATTSLMRHSGSDTIYYNGVSERIVDTIANELIGMIAEDTYTTVKDTISRLHKEYQANVRYITAVERKHTDRVIEIANKKIAQADKKTARAERKLENYINNKSREELLKVTKRLLEGKRIPPNVKDQVRSSLKALGFEKVDLESIHFDDKKAERLSCLKNIYDELKSEFDNYDDERIEKIVSALGSKHLDEMKIGDVNELLKVFKSFEHEMRTGRRMLNEKETRELSAIASSEIGRINRAPRIDAVSKSGRIRNGYVGLFLTPENLIKRATGFDGDSELLKYFRELNDGQRKMLAYINEVDAMFAEFINDKNFVKNLMSRKIELIPGVYITPNQLIALKLHSECADNLRHIEEKGIRIPKFENYVKGQGETQGSRIVRLDKARIEQVAGKLNDREKAYMDKIREYFNGKQKNAINKVSLVLRGYEEATVENYFPIYTDKNFLAQNYVDISQDGLPTFRWWSLNERDEDANAIMTLVGATEVVDRSTKSTARYWGMAIPMRDFKALYNASVITYDEAGIDVMKEKANFDNIRDYNNRRTIEKSIFRRNVKNISSIKESITQRFGQAANLQIQDILKDLSASKVVYDATGFLNKLRGGYAASVLSLNLSSFFVQLSGIASGGSVLGVGNVMRAYATNKRFDENKLSEIEKYTPLIKTRMRGFTTQELGSVTTGLGRGVLSSTYHTAMESKWLDWMTNVDIWTVKGLWNAAEIKVARENPGLKNSDYDAYMKKAAEVFNDAVEKTQPNSTPLQRPRVMRLKGAWSFLTMFKSQAYATLNVSYEAWAEYRAAQGRAKVSTPAGNVEAIKRNKAILSAARKKFLATALTCLLQALISEAARFIGKMLMHDDKAYKDDEGEITVNSALKEIGSGSFGAMLEPFPFIGNVYNAIESYTKYGPSTIADFLSETHTSMVNDVIASLFNVVGVINKENKTGADVTEAIYESIVAIGSLAGIPVNNARKLAHGVAKWVNEIREGGGYLADYTELVYTNDLYDKKNGKIVISDKAVEVAANAYINDYDSYSAILDDIYASGADYKNAVTRITNKAKKKLDSSK